jgi:hypothetical protein
LRRTEIEADVESGKVEHRTSTDPPHRLRVLEEGRREVEKRGI